MLGAGGTDGGELSPDRSESLESVLGHDLANHIQVIQIQAELLLERLDDAVAVERLQAIKRQTVAANSLVQTVCQVGPGTSRNQLDVVDVGRVLREEIRRIRSTYPDADVSANVTEELPVRADGLLSSVFWNLLQNAVQHNDSSAPSVAVTARSAGPGILVSIEDDGPGLPHDIEAELRGERPARPGSGVGVVRTLAGRYDVAIAVDGSDGGTTVSLEFPRAPPSKDS